MTERRLSLPLWRAALLALPSLVLTCGLSACGGDKAKTVDTGPFDDDGDGVYHAVDCDDENPDVGAETTWYADADEDSFGDPTRSEQACGQPSGYVDNGDDCDDTTEFVSPIAKERCDNIDNNCNGEIDEDAFDATIWYPDADNDGYGDASSPDTSCSQPSGDIADGSDCDDSDASINPSACEICGDGIDNNCNGIEVCDTLDTSFTVLRGVAAGDAAGSEVKGNVDLNGDGFADTLVAAPGADAVYAVFGPLGGTLSLSDADATQTGTGDDGTGTAISAFGDADGDGYDEAIIGLPGDDSAGTDAGGAELWSGPDMTITAMIEGEVAGDEAGSVVTKAGDINGDGTPDLFISAPASAVSADEGGAAYTVYGPITGTVSLGGSDGVWYGSVDGLRAGTALAGVGDIDGDGCDDLMFGEDGLDSTSRQTGAVFLLYGPAEGLNDTADIDVKWFGEYTGDAAAYPSGVGDINGDGLPDVAVSAPNATADGTANTGVIYIWYGAHYTVIDNVRHGDATLTGEADGDALTLPHGGAVEGTGDLNGDGIGDLWIGATAADDSGTDAGAAYVLYGPLSGDIDLCGSDIHYFGEAAGDAAGTSAVGAGDVDGDGIPDLLVGAPGNDAAGTDAGAAYVVLGGSWL